MNDHVSEVASLSHDIRNMMATILLASEVLEDSTDNRTVDLAKRISKVADACTAFCRAAIDAETSPRSKDETKSVFLADLINEIVGQLEIQHGQKLSFRVHCSEKLTAPLCQARLYRVLFNLIENAAKAVCESDGSAVDIRVEKRDGALAIEVIDDGPGFNASGLQMVLLKTKPDNVVDKRQHGIGLPTVVSLSRQMGGRLTKMDTAERGTSFRLLFPNCFQPTKQFTPMIA